MAQRFRIPDLFGDSAYDYVESEPSTEVAMADGEDETEETQELRDGAQMAGLHQDEHEGDGEDEEVNGGPNQVREGEVGDDEAETVMDTAIDGIPEGAYRQDENGTYWALHYNGDWYRLMREEEIIHDGPIESSESEDEIDRVEEIDKQNGNDDSDDDDDDDDNNETSTGVDGENQATTTNLAISTTQAPAPTAGTGPPIYPTPSVGVAAPTATTAPTAPTAPNAPTAPAAPTVPAAPALTARVTREFRSNANRLYYWCPVAGCVYKKDRWGKIVTHFAQDHPNLSLGPKPNAPP